MKIPGLITTALVAVAVGLASPVSAQHRRGDGQGGNRGGGESHATQRAAPRAAPAQAPAPAPAPRFETQQRRSDNNWRRGDFSPVVPPRAQTMPAVPSMPAVPRSASPQAGGFRTDSNRYNNGNNGNWNGNRSYGSNGNYRNNGNSGSRYYGNSGYRNYGYRNYAYRGGYYHYAPARFYRPYYSFRPRFSLGFGLWVGYPVPYAYSYYDPFYYSAYPYPSTAYPSTVYPSNPYPPSTSYPPSDYPQSPYPQSSYPPADGSDPNSIGVQPGQTATGGLSFEISPTSAEVLIDGNLVGTVGEFTSSSQPLGLSAGRHHVDIEAAGYRTISFDVDIIAGQVVPYQGAMERQ